MRLAPKKRIQLTLFVSESDSETIEHIRKKFNPKQFELIKSHVTLCREEELENLARIVENLNQLKSSPIVIPFEKVKRFSEGKGVLLPAKKGNVDFDNLRHTVLKGIIDNPKKQEAHITLMHPRNSTCTDILFETIQNVSFPKILTFNKITLIAQEMDEPWSIIKEFKFY